MREDHPGLLLINSMHTASRMRDAIYDMLKKQQPKRMRDYKLFVDFTMQPDEFTYAYNLRVYSVETKKLILSMWSQTRDGLVCDENIAKLLILYNS